MIVMVFPTHHRGHCRRQRFGKSVLNCFFSNESSRFNLVSCEDVTVYLFYMVLANEAEDILLLIF